MEKDCLEFLEEKDTHAIIFRDIRMYKGEENEERAKKILKQFKSGIN